MLSAGLLSSHMAMMRMIIIIIKTQEDEHGFALISKNEGNVGTLEFLPISNLQFTGW